MGLDTLGGWFFAVGVTRCSVGKFIRSGLPPGGPLKGGRVGLWGRGFSKIHLDLNRVRSFAKNMFLFPNVVCQIRFLTILFLFCYMLLFVMFLRNPVPILLPRNPVGGEKVSPGRMYPYYLIHPIQKPLVCNYSRAQ